MRPVNINLRSNDQSKIFHPQGRPDANYSPPVFREPVEAERARVDDKKDNKFIVKTFDRMIDISLFMIFFGFPLFFTGLTFQGIVFEKQIYFYAWLLLGLVAWAAKGVTTGEMNVRRTPLDLPIVGFWLAYLLATIFSVDRWHSFWGAFADPSRGFMSITALVIAYYLIFSNFNIKRFRLMFSALISSGIIISVWTTLAIMNIKFLPDSIAQYAPISMSGSVLGVAIIVSALIPLLTVAILKIAENETMSATGGSAYGGKAVFRKIILTVLMLGLGLNLFLTLALYNFVPWLALFAGIVILLIFILAQIVRPSARWTWLPMALFVVVMAVRMIGVVPIAKINFAEVKPLDWGMSMNVAKDALKDKAILGSGPATFGYDFSLYKPQDFNANMFYNLRFLQGTGIMMEALPTIGIAGAFFLAILLLSFVSFSIYILAREKEKNKLMTLGLFSSATIFLVGALSTKVEGTVLIMAALTEIMALAIAMHENKSPENYLSLSLKASPKFALALAFVFMVVSAGVAFLFVFLGKIYVADFYAGSAGRVKVENREATVVNMTQAIKLYPKEGRYYGQLGQYYMVLTNAEALKGENERDVEKIKQYLNSSIAVSNMGKEMMKNDVGSVELLAQIYENSGYYIVDSYNLAVENYQKALELEPQNPNYYVKIGQIKMTLAAMEKDNAKKKQLVEEAKESFASATQKKADLPEGHYNLALAQNALGETDAAIESAKKSVTLAQKNGDYIINLARMMEARGKEADLKDAEQLYRAVIASNDKDVNGHFYLGLLYEKQKRDKEAKEEYGKVISLLPDNNDETKKQLQKMMANIDAGIENTPQNLGLTQDQGAVAGEETGQ